MPDNAKPDRSLRQIDKKLNNIDNEMKALYQTTYNTRPDNKENMGNITNTIDDNIDELLSKINNRSSSDISNLYIRLQKKNGGTMQQINDSVEELFNDSALLNSIDMEAMCKSIKAEDYQYDLICRYMPKLDDALEIKKDNVLSSDNFTKEFINAVSDRSSQEFIQQFNDRATAVKDKYKFQDLCEEIYDDCSRYGEYFLYHVPYKNALERMLKRKQNYTGGISPFSTQRNMLGEGGRVIIESTNISKNLKEAMRKEFSDTIKDGKITLVFETTNMIGKVVDYVNAQQTIKNKGNSLTESYITETESGEEGTIKSEKGFNNLIAPDGFIDSKKENNIKIKEVNGSVIYKIPRDQIIPVVIGESFVVGYLYFEVKNDYIDELVMRGQTYNSLTNYSSLQADEFDQQNDMLISQIASQMSNAIDAQFINSNLDMKEEIFSILRYNDQFCATKGNNTINVSFLPVEDVHHIYFRLNHKTHRGISDLNKAMVPAMLYCLLYLSDIIGKISRAQDKRIYYVKQNIETNVAKTLLNVINQIKKGNMGMRQLENMNSIFNVIGKYNDHIIPMGQSGDAPIQFEVMQGQQVETPTELMDRMEDMAVTSTEVPLEFVQSVNQVDFATRFTMSNSKFLRKIFKRQRICQEHFTNIFRKLYNFEYGENEQTIKILLPAPLFLTLTNSAQLINNNKEYATALADVVLANEDQEVKDEFIALMTRKQLGTYVDFDMVDSMVLEAQHITSYKKTDVVNDTGDDGTDSDEY